MAEGSISLLKGKEEEVEEREDKLDVERKVNFGFNGSLVVQVFRFCDRFMRADSAIVR
jgi:hypothetical protein